jgi:serine/threonine-protein kinase
MDGPSRGAAWGPDDAIIFATGNLETGLQQVSAAGGTPTVLTRPDAARGELDHVRPAWLPDGRGVLFTVVTRRGVDIPRVAVLERGAGTWRTLIEGGNTARYVSSGHLVYAATRALWAVRFDLSTLTVEGAPVEVLPGVRVSGD